MIAGNFNPSTMATNLHFLYHPLPQIKFETKAQTGAFPNASVFRNSVGSLELLGQSSTISLTFYNPKRDSGRMTIGFLHSFNDKLCAGAELLTAWSDRSQVKASVALAGRFVVVLFNWKDRWGCVGKRYKRHFNEPLNFRFCRTHGSLAFFFVVRRSSISMFALSIAFKLLDGSFTVRWIVEQKKKKLPNSFGCLWFVTNSHFTSTHIVSLQILIPPRLHRIDGIKGRIRCQCMASTERFIAARRLIYFQ